MASKSDFTEQEWEALHKGAVGAGFLVSVADRSLFDSLKEAGALARHLGNARQSTSSPLVRELAETRGTGFSLTSSPQEIETQTIDALRTAKTALETKAPDELTAYRQFVLEIARSVGSAAGGGETAEAEAVSKVESALA